MVETVSHNREDLPDKTRSALFGRLAVFPIAPYAFSAVNSVRPRAQIKFLGKL